NGQDNGPAPAKGEVIGGGFLAVAHDLRLGPWGSPGRVYGRSYCACLLVSVEKSKYFHTAEAVSPGGGALLSRDNVRGTAVGRAARGVRPHTAVTVRHR